MEKFLLIILIWTCSVAWSDDTKKGCVDKIDRVLAPETSEFSLAWPLAERSLKYPFVIRYQKKQDQKKAQEVRQYLEKSWEIQVEKLGFRPPFSYSVNKSGHLNVFLQRGGDTAVEGIYPVEKKDVWWDAYQVTISIDAWGDYAGDILDSTMAHEFNHTLHAAYDWFETAGFFETSATYIQDKVFPEDNDYLKQIVDFQRHPDWSIDRNDDYETWFMYGASLYLFFLEDSYFKKNPQFLAQIWEGSRNSPRPIDPKTSLPAPETNEPDWIDALEKILPPGKNYADTVVEFARWRFYTGSYDDGKHFHDAHLQKIEGGVYIKKKLSGSFQKYKSSGPMLLGTEYIELECPNEKDKINIRFTGDNRVRWVIQAMPALTPNSDGEFIEAQGVVSFGNLKKRVLAVTPCPLDNSYDPDTRTDKRYSFSLEQRK